MITQYFTVNILRNKISLLRTQLKQNPKLSSQVGKSPKSDKFSRRVNIQVRIYVNGPTETEIVRTIIEYNEGVITKQNTTGDLGWKIKLGYGIKSNFKKFIIYYTSLICSHFLLRINEISSDYWILIIVLGASVPIAISTTYGINVKFN